MSNYCYLRVSTEEQTIENQRSGIQEYCKKHNITIDKEFKDEGISGTIEAKKRNLRFILKEIKKGDVLIVSELSRLGRNTKDVLNTCEILTNKGVDVIFIKENMRMDNSPMGKMLRTIMAAFAQLERDMIAMRTKEALARLKANGVILGRPKDSKNKEYKADKYNDKIIDLYDKGYPIRIIAEKLKLNRMTISKYLKRIGKRTDADKFDWGKRNRPNIEKRKLERLKLKMEEQEKKRQEKEKIKEEKKKQDIEKIQKQIELLTKKLKEKTND